MIGIEKKITVSHGRFLENTREDITDLICLVTGLSVEEHDFQDGINYVEFYPVEIEVSGTRDSGDYDTPPSSNEVIESVYVNGTDFTKEMLTLFSETDLISYA